MYIKYVIQKGSRIWMLEDLRVLMVVSSAAIVSYYHYVNPP
jgi:hypothetical protein